MRRERKLSAFTQLLNSVSKQDLVSIVLQKMLNTEKEVDENLVDRVEVHRQKKSVLQGEKSTDFF